MIFTRRSTLSSPRNAHKKKQRLITRSIVGVLAVLVFIGCLIFNSWQASVSIYDIKVEGNHVITNAQIERLVNEELDQKYLGLFSKRNIALYPKDRLEEKIRDSWRRVESVSISTDWPNTITVSLVEEKPRYLWCGPAAAENDADAPCYFLNEEGFVFSLAPQFSGSVYVRFFGTSTSAAPVGGRYLDEREFQNVIAFIETAESLSLNPHKLISKGNKEYTLGLPGPSQVFFTTRDPISKAISRLSYLVDHNTFSVGKKDASNQLEYLDLRYSKNIYYKLK